jgi:NAD(P)-dependent dehydrogenase (short-subunit alcohol dehydrogenase family)
VAFITGGAAGFGRAFAEALSHEGAAVAIADVHVAGAARAAAELNTPATPAIAVTCDVAQGDMVDQAVERVVNQLGGVDVLINNAARHLKKYSQPFSALTRDEIRGMFDVNVIGIINCSLACRPSMSARGQGVIVNMASGAGFSSKTPYGVTKVAVRGLTIAFANEFSTDGIRVNSIAPTLTPTDGVQAEYSEEEMETSVATRQLLRRRAAVDDITRTMMFLCSDEASFITGETIRVTGGAFLSI